MVNWLLEMKIRGQSVKVTHGWVSRFFGQQHELWPTAGDDAKTGKNRQRQALPLPLMSVSQTTITPAPDRNVNAIVSQMGFNLPRSESKIWAGPTQSKKNLYAGNGTTKSFSGVALTDPPIQSGSIEIEFVIGGTTYTETDDGNGVLTNNNGKLISSSIAYDTGYVTILFDVAPDNNTLVKATYYPTKSWNQLWTFQWPMAIDIEYQIDLWAKTGQDLQQMRTAIYSRFEHHPKETFLQADFPFYGSKLLPLEFIADHDVSDLESDEKERVLRRSFMMVMHGWILKKPTLKRTIRNLHVVFLDGLPDESGMGWYLDDSHYNLQADGTELLSVEENPSITPPNKTLLWISFNDGILVHTGDNV